VKPWATKDIVGVDRFLDRVWKLHAKPVVDGAGDDALERLTHKTIRKVTDDLEQMRFNTAISALMVLANELSRREEVPRFGMEALVGCLNPMAPHITEELWELLGGQSCLAEAPWPTYEPTLCVDDEVEIVVQVNGKVRARMNVARDTDRGDLETMALANERIQQWTEGTTVRKVIVVPNKLVNLVVG